MSESTWKRQLPKSWPATVRGHGAGTRELRGGSFLSLASVLRSALRYNLPPTLRSPEYAFRLARTLEPIPKRQPPDK
jgi:formylglycine-generating enzyme required for sulfatase activity